MITLLVVLSALVPRSVFCVPTSVTWHGPASVETDQPTVVVSWDASNWTYTGVFVTANAELDILRQGTVATGYQTSDLSGNPVQKVIFNPTALSSNDVNITFNCTLSADYAVTISLWGVSGGVVFPIPVSTHVIAKACEDPTCPSCKAAGVCGAYGLCSCPAGTGWQLPTCDHEAQVATTICPLDFITGTFRFLAPEDGGDEHHGLDWIGLFPGGGPLDPTNSPYINTFAYVMCNSPLPCEQTEEMGRTDYSVSLGLLLPPTSYITWGLFYADGYSVVTQEHTDADSPCNGTIGCPCLPGYFGAYCERGCSGFYEIQIPGLLNIDQSDLSNGATIGHGNNALCAFRLIFSNWATMELEFEFLGLGNGDELILFQVNDTMADFGDFNSTNVNTSTTRLTHAKNRTLTSDHGDVVYLLFKSNSYGVGRGMKAQLTATEKAPNLYLLAMLPVLLIVLVLALVVLLVLFLVVIPRRRNERPPDFHKLTVPVQRQARLEDAVLAYSSLGLKKASRQLKHFEGYVSGDNAPGVVVQLFEENADRYIVEDFVDLIFDRDPTSVTPFLISVLKSELRKIKVDKHSHVATIFRVDSAFTFGYVRYLHLTGMPFLWDAFHGLLNELKADRASSGGGTELDLEIDPNKSEELRSSVLRLKIFARRLLLDVTGMAQDIPVPIVDLTRRAVKEVISLVGQKAEDNAHKLVGNLIFLRFFSQALVNAEQWGISIGVIGPKLRRNLVLLSKVLQTAANGESFEEANFMAVMNEEVKEYQDEMAGFYEAIASGRKLRSKDVQSFDYPVRLPGALHEAVLKDLVVQAQAIYTQPSSSSNLQSSGLFESASYSEQIKKVKRKNKVLPLPNNQGEHASTTNPAN